MSAQSDDSDDSPEPQRRLRLYARRDASGEVRGTFLCRADQVVALWEESGLGEEIALPLPAGALSAVFRRYGKPLEPGVTPAPVPGADDDDVPLVVPLGDGSQARLWRFQFMPYGWVYPADYLLWEHPWPLHADDAAGGEAVAAPAPLVVSALSALCRAAGR
jgi:hypothetical protein